jgi:PKD repeat protein
VDYQHGSAHARTGIWNGASASQIDLNQPGSPVPGPVFSGNAAAGSAWYSGTKYPVVYQYTYFHGDYGQGWIKNFKFKADNSPDSVKTFGDNLGPVVFIEYNPKDQWLYYVSYPSNIYKLTYSVSVNNPPIAVASQDVVYGPKPLQVHFTGGNSADPENLPLTYSWNFGDGTTNSSAKNPTHTFNPATNNPIAFTVTLTVTDNIGQLSVKTLKVYVNDTPPQVFITSFNDGDLYSMSQNTILPLQAFVTDAESPDHNLSYTWQTFLHHNNHEHPEATDTNRITSTVISPVGCDGNVYFFRIQLTVTDPSGLSTTVQGNIYPACNTPVANFIADKTSDCPYTHIIFTDLSSNGPTSWAWSFPGGSPSTSTLQNPEVNYFTMGSFAVSLSSTNTGGTGSVTKNGYITINPRPNATITPAGTDSVCAQQSVLLSANTGSFLTYQWIKGDVDISGATQSNYNASSAGNYKVEVTKSTTGCKRTSINKKIVHRIVDANATANGPTTFCAGDSVKLSANSGPYTYRWQKNNVAITGTSAFKKNYYAKTSGNYKVVVTDANGCTKASNTITVTVNCRISEDEHNNKFTAALSPNPVHENGILTVILSETDKITAEVFDALGRFTFSLADNLHMNDGENQISFDVSLLTPGIYFIKISNTKESKTLKLTVDN